MPGMTPHMSTHQDMFRRFTIRMRIAMISECPNNHWNHDDETTILQTGDCTSTIVVVVVAVAAAVAS
jgi:hypothetical protein